MNTNQQKREPTQLFEDNLEQVSGGEGLSTAHNPNANPHWPSRADSGDSAWLMSGMDDSLVKGIITRRPN